MARFYAVKKGKKTGIFTNWFARMNISRMYCLICNQPSRKISRVTFSTLFDITTRDDCAELVLGFKGAEYKSFKEEKAAQNWMAENEKEKDALHHMAARAAAPASSRPRKRQKKAESKSRAQGSGMGKAGTRSAAQKKQVQESAKQLLEGFAANTIICFTDGACEGNPGPCGAGAIVEFGNKYCKQQRLAASTEPIKELQKHQALGQGTNNIGELTGVEMAVDLVTQHLRALQAAKGENLSQEEKKFGFNTVEILTDSKYTQGVLCKSWKAKKNQALIARIKEKLASLWPTLRVHIHWVGGHSGIGGNERADQLANLGVAESKAKLCKPNQS
eukprot:g76401.t1